MFDPSLTGKENEPFSPFEALQAARDARIGQHRLQTNFRPRPGILDVIHEVLPDGRIIAYRNLSNGVEPLNEFRGGVPSTPADLLELTGNNELSEIAESPLLRFLLQAGFGRSQQL